MAYNLTSIVEGNSTLGFVQGVNSELMLGFFGTLMLIGIVVVFFLSINFTTGDTEKAIATSGFLSFIFAILLRAIDLVPNKVLVITALIAAGSIGFMWKRN